ncbi:MAG: DUF1266 domain-containing protein [Thermoguttaceae bacterium]
MNAIRCTSWVAVILFAAMAFAAETNEAYLPKFVRDANDAAPTEQQKRWALATFGVITEAYHRRHDLLGGVEPSPANRKAAHDELLRGAWQLETKQQVLDWVKRSEQGGHRQWFDKLAEDVAKASPEELAELRTDARIDAKTAARVELVAKYRKKLRNKSLAGWDFARDVGLCGRAYVAGYLTEAEAWQQIMPAARAMQATFDSWADLGENYLIGREFWFGDDHDQQLMKAAYRRLRSDASSPWVKIPWRLDLTPPKAKPTPTPKKPIKGNG